jgi:hypothetical protein
MLRLAAILLLAIAFGLSACGTETLRASELESEIQRQFAQQTGTGVTAVDCPDDIEASEGNRFRCTARFETGENLPVNVVLTNDEGAFRASLAALLISSLEQQIERQAGEGADVECPETRPIRRNDVFECSLELNEERQTVEVRQQDDEGNVTFRVRE